MKNVMKNDIFFVLSRAPHEPYFQNAQNALSHSTTPFYVNISDNLASATKFGYLKKST